MPDLRRSLTRLIAELRRRRVLRVVAVYVVAAAAVAQAADVMLPRLGLPDWTVSLVVVLSVLALPLVAALAWAFEVTPEGLRRSPRTPAPEPPPGRRWPLLAALVALVLVGGWWGSIRFAPAPPADGAPGGDGGVVVVLPFTFRGGDQYAYLGNGMVDLLTTKLDGAGSLRAVGPRAVMGVVRQAGGELDARAAESVARRLRAGLYVLGQVVEVAGRVQLTASLHRLGDDVASPPVSAQGASEDLFALVDELAAQLLSQLAGGPGARVTRVAAATTHSLPALRAYLEGEELLRGGHFPSALEAFRRAIEADSSFALAHYRLSIAAEWSGSADATRAAEEAYRRSGRLSEHDRRLVEALLAWRRGDAVEAERLYRAIVGAYPDDVEAWFQLAEVLFHYSPWRGGTVSDAREPFERVLFYEPDHVTALWHLTRIASIEDRLDDLDSLVARVEALAPEGDRMLELTSMRAFRRGDAAAMAAAEQALGEAIDLTRWMTVWNMASYAADPAAALRVAGPLVDGSRAREVRATGHLVRGHMELARGRPAAALRELDAAEALDPAAGALHRAVFALHPGLPPAPGALRAARDRLAAWEPDPSYTPPAILYFDPATPVRVEARTYLLGILSARIGETAAAEAAIRELERAGRGGEQPGLMADYLRVLRAEVALARGDTATAMAQLDQLRGEVWYAHAMQSQLISNPYGRFRRAEVLEAVGRDAEAAAAFSFDELSAYDLAYEGVAALRRARVLERLGQTAAAARAYRTAATFWSEPEPAYAGLAAAARDGPEGD